MEGQRLSYLRLAIVVLGLTLVTQSGMALPTDTIPAIRKPHTFDQHLFWSMNHSALAGSATDGEMKFASNSLLPVSIAIPVSMVAGGLALANNHDGWLLASNGLTIAAGTAITIALQELVIKPLVRRDRPYKALDSVRWIDSSATGYSFPSSHAATSWGLAVGLSLRYPKWYIIAPTVIYALIVTLSRPYLGVHFPTDVATGAVLGSLVQYALYRFQFSTRTVRGSGAFFGSAASQAQPMRVSVSLPLGN